MATPSLLIIPDRFKAAKLYSQLPESGAGDFTVTRGTTATRVNASGLIESVASGVPRIDYTGGGCGSLLVEPAATNSIRNNTMVGAVTGTPGTLPTNWTIAESTPSIISRQVIGTGTENGVEYLDLRIFGTAIANGSVFISFDSTTQITASSGQVWSSSLYAKTIAGTPSTLVLNNRWGLSGGAFVSSSTQTITLTSQLSRLSFASTAPATAERVQPRFEIVIQNGVAYDFTIRIGLPQMELGAVATSVIKTSTVAVTRNADVISLSSVSGLIGQTEGVFFVDFVAEAPSEVRRISLSDGTNANRVFIGQQSNGTIQFFISVSSSSQVNFITSTSYTNGTRLKIALAYKENDFVGYINGAQIFTDNLGTVPATSKFAFADATDISTFRARISAAAIYTERLSNAELAQLTTL